VELKPGKLGIVIESGKICEVQEDAQQSLLDAKITEGWKMITIDSKPFSKELLIQKIKGTKNYTLELIQVTRAHNK
jgi:hypothetical protein